jgi:hypothetical protein
MPLHYVPSYQLVKRSHAVGKDVYPSAKEVSHYEPSTCPAPAAGSPEIAVATIAVESRNTLWQLIQTQSEGIPPRLGHMKSAGAGAARHGDQSLIFILMLRRLS